VTAVKRRVVVGATLVVAGGAGAWRWWGSRPVQAPATVVSAPTTTVLRTDLIAREQIPGVLGYAAPRQLVHPGPPGVLTAVAAPGSTVQRGQTVYEVDGAPVVLLHGSRPVWREFAPGMPPGQDVRQLEENLAALGLRGSTVDERFTSATAAAIRSWQRRLDRPATGRLPLGAVVFAPADARILDSLVPLGGRVGAEPVLRIASTTRGVTAALPLGRAGQVRIGGEVEVTVPGGRRIAGTVTAIGAPVQEPGGPVNTIPMTVALRDPAAAGDLDQVPVQVSIAVVERRGVLAVPVTALAAAAAGGYEIVVVEGGRRAVPVRPGLIDERAGLVEITGDGLAEGLRVEVPAS